MSIPTRGEVYAQIMEHLRLLEEGCATMAHLHNTENTHKDKLLVHGWLGIAELFKRARGQITKMAMGRMQ